MKYLRISLSILITFIFALSLTGCGMDIPFPEQGHAKRALRHALEKGADKKAPAEFAAAQAIFDQASSQFRKSHEGNIEAKKGFFLARQAFEKAMYVAQPQWEKMAVNEEAKKWLSDLEAEWTRLESEAVHSKQLNKDAWEADGKLFKEKLKTAKEIISTDTMGAAVILEDMQNITNKWDKIFRPLIPLKNCSERKSNSAASRLFDNVPSL